MLRPGRRHHHRNDEAAAAAAGDLLINAIDDSITSVFVVTFKMALFFGVYTYVVNCMFGVSVVYLTSIVAAFLACLPLLGTYWCALIGVLELWLVAHKPLSAALYGVMHLLPSLLAVDRAIYSEIKVRTCPRWRSPAASTVSAQRGSSSGRSCSVCSLSSFR